MTNAPGDQRREAFALLVVTYFMAVVDATIVTVCGDRD
jgi:hypothetical protein